MGLQAPHSNPQGQVEEQEGWPRNTWTEVEGRCPFQSDLVTSTGGGVGLAQLPRQPLLPGGGGVLHLCATTAFFIVNCGLPFHFSCNGHPTGILNVSSFTVKVLQYCWVGWYRIKDGPRRRATAGGGGGGSSGGGGGGRRDPWRVPPVAGVRPARAAPPGPPSRRRAGTPPSPRGTVPLWRGVLACTTQWPSPIGRGGSNLPQRAPRGRLLRSQARRVFFFHTSSRGSPRRYFGAP